MKRILKRAISLCLALAMLLTLSYSGGAENKVEEIITVKASAATKKKVSAKSKSSTSKKKKYKDYGYHDNIDIENNVFMDSLIYTGYNIKKHRKDNLMWVYILASQKRGRGWLSDIGYSGASSGYEKTKSGKPDIKRIARQGGLVCASFVSYVYFNYLPNVAGIDTSMLKKPRRSYNAHEWYKAGKDWVKKGYSKEIDFKAYMSGGEIKIKPEEEIPIGSLMVFCDARNRADYCSHICIYAGYKNGYNWVYHVGNDNGPEFCAVERMYYGPDPQWPISIITTPSQIRMAAGVSITAEDDEGKPLKKTEIKLKNTKTGKTYKLGKTNKKGKLSAEGLPFGKYTLSASGSKTKLKVNLKSTKNGLSKIALIKKGKKLKKK